MVDAFYNNTYSFSKYSIITYGNFLYLIGMIRQTMPHVQILFLHVNVFAIILDTWHIIKIWNEINTFLRTKLESNTQTQKRERGL